MNYRRHEVKQSTCQGLIYHVFMGKSIIEGATYIHLPLLPSSFRHFIVEARYLPRNIFPRRSFHPKNNHGTPSKATCLTFFSVVTSGIILLNVLVAIQAPSIVNPPTSYPLPYLVELHPISVTLSTTRRPPRLVSLASSRRPSA